VLCVSSLILTLAQDNLEAYKVSCTKAAHRLYKVRGRLCRENYSDGYSSLWLTASTLPHTLTTKYRRRGCKSSCSVCYNTIRRPVRLFV